MPGRSKVMSTWKMNLSIRNMTSDSTNATPMATKYRLRSNLGLPVTSCSSVFL